MKGVTQSCLLAVGERSLRDSSSFQDNMLYFHSLPPTQFHIPLQSLRTLCAPSASHTHPRPLSLWSLLRTAPPSSDSTACSGRSQVYGRACVSEKPLRFMLEIARRCTGTSVCSCVQHPTRAQAPRQSQELWGPRFHSNSSELLGCWRAE